MIMHKQVHIFSRNVRVICDQTQKKKKHLVQQTPKDETKILVSRAIFYASL